MKELDLARSFCYDYLNNLLDTHVLAGLLDQDLSDVTNKYLLDHIGFIPEGMFIAEDKIYKSNGYNITQKALKAPVLHKDGDRLFNADSVFLPILRLENKLSCVLSCGDGNLYVETFNKKIETVCVVSRTYNKQKTNIASIKVEEEMFFGARERRELKAILRGKTMCINTIKSLAQFDICGCLRDTFQTQTKDIE